MYSTTQKLMNQKLEIDTDSDLRFSLKCKVETDSHPRLSIVTNMSTLSWMNEFEKISKTCIYKDRFPLVS